MTEMDFDKIVEEIGSFGRFQIIVFILTTLSSLKTAYNYYIVAFQTVDIPFVCSANVNSSAVIASSSNFTFSQSQQCFSGINSTERCESWTFFHNDENRYTNSMREEWSLVCHRAFYVPSIISAYAIGMSFAFLLAIVGDRFGRRIVLIGATAAEAVITLIEIAMPGPLSFMAMHALRGFMAKFSFLGLIYMSELVGPRHRAFVSNMFWLSWCFGIMTTPLLAYFVQDWRWLQVVTNWTSLALIGYFFLPESPRWLFLAGRTKEAFAVCHTIAKWNKLSFDEELYSKTFQSNSNEEDNIELKPTKAPGMSFRTLIDVVKTKKMAMKSAIIFLSWLIISFTYYGISLDSKFVVDNRYINVFLNGCIEIPGYFIAWFAAHRVGRRNSMVLFLITSATFIIILPNIPKRDALIYVRAGVALIGKLLITAGYSVLVEFTSEIYPTTVRFSGTFISSIFARIGTTLAPHIAMSSSMPRSTSAVIIGTITLINGILLIAMPETKDQKLPQTIEEADAFKWSLGCGFCENRSDVAQTEEIENVNESTKDELLQMKVTKQSNV